MTRKNALSAILALLHVRRSMMLSSNYHPLTGCLSQRESNNLDVLKKEKKTSFKGVIPAEAGIHSFKTYLDSHWSLPHTGYGVGMT